MLGKAGLQIHQVFEKFSAHSVVDDIDKRFEHFKSRIWPRLRDSGSAGKPQPCLKFETFFIHHAFEHCDLQLLEDAAFFVKASWTY